MKVVVNIKRDEVEYKIWDLLEAYRYLYIHDFETQAIKYGKESISIIFWKDENDE